MKIKVIIFGEINASESELRNMDLEEIIEKMNISEWWYEEG